MSLHTFREVSTLDAPAAEVWRRITDFKGINDELMPLLRMRPPREHRNTTVATVPLGTRLGRAWIFCFGFVPIDYDALTITELEPEGHFKEVSTMLSMRRWEHRRELRPASGGRTEVVDTVSFAPRFPLPDPMIRLVECALRSVFAHRHRRLRRYFARGGERDSSQEDLSA